MALCRGTGLFWILLGRRSSSGPNRAPVRSLSRLPHRDLFRLSVIEPDRFWGPAAADRLHGAEPFQRVQDCHLNRARIRWFLGVGVRLPRRRRVWLHGGHLLDHRTKPPLSCLTAHLCTRIQT
ncbi:acetyl-coenzyme A synthetase 2-like, mitochondrial isoform X2 [Poecilia latipinna]|uniref:acetyl-coenzyme A synthetase 2-like, mitochondrial isoform X2 n=1 Tax=Poecilia latipinna TaxID=48699 RepID=UPI00072DDF3A|nr:PREDICTED: acetyl-coenzyme A synthetase 2-like, mitochondrial isoform X2 [Poecilia latipinna]